MIGDSPLEGHGVRLDASNMPGDPATYAGQLYGKLHELDQQGTGLDRDRASPDTPEWAGLRDRIIRAAN